MKIKKRVPTWAMLFSSGTSTDTDVWHLQPCVSAWLRTCDWVWFDGCQGAHHLQPCVSAWLRTGDWVWFGGCHRVHHLQPCVSAWLRTGDWVWFDGFLGAHPRAFLSLHSLNMTYICTSTKSLLPLDGSPIRHTFSFSEQNKETYQHLIRFLAPVSFRSTLPVPYHGGGRRKKINAWYLNTHMVYL